MCTAHGPGTPPLSVSGVVPQLPLRGADHDVAGPRGSGFNELRARIPGRHGVLTQCQHMEGLRGKLPRENH
ncbi:hypothetical protein GCM10009859_02810 [Kocuria salsicia]